MKIEDRNNGKIVQYTLTDENLKDIEPGGQINIPSTKLDGSAWEDCGDNGGVAGIIILDESGHLFTHQSGGFACNHPNARGLFFVGGLELSGCLLEIEEFVYGEFCGRCVPRDHFWCKEGGLDACDSYGDVCGQITNRDANKIDDIFNKHGFGNCRVDRSKLSKSQEAWIYGMIYKVDNGKRLGHERCVFVMNNSD